MTLKKVIEVFFFTGLFFFSFNDYEGIPFFGEYRKEAGAIFFFIGFIILLINSYYTKKISLPYKSKIFKLLLIFVAWCFISTLFNLSDVTNNYFKHTGGINRFIRQYSSLLISTIIFFLFYWNVISKMSIRDILYKIRRVFFLALIIASIYGFLEIGVSFFGISSLFNILKLFDYFPFLEVDLEGYGRISSICYEAPFLAIYLISIAGWMFSYVLTEKSYLKFIPTILVLILTFFSGSRTGLLVVFIQFFVFVTILFKYKKYRRYISYSLFFCSIFFSLLLIFNGQKIIKAVSEKVESLNFSKNLTKSVSNQSRFGMQYAALQVFKEHPIVGVGFGQQTYSARFHYPGWATKNNYEYEIFYKNSAEPTFPPAYNIYTRLLAEIGLIGTSLFCYILYLSISGTKKLIKKSSNEKLILSYILLISFVGLFINWMQIDSFRMYCVWICIVILIRLNQEEKTIYNE